MKLYATIASERATKSQGGNDLLDIDILVGNKTRKNIGTLQVYVYDKNPESVVVKWVSHDYLGGQILHNEELPK